MEFEIGGNADLEFKPTPINALRVMVPEGGEILDGLFQNDDLIFATEGKPFADVMAMQVVLSPLFRGAPCEVTVERGGQTLQIAVTKEQSAQLIPLMSDEKFSFLPAHRQAE